MVSHFPHHLISTFHLIVNLFQLIIFSIFTKYVVPRRSFFTLRDSLSRKKLRPTKVQDRIPIKMKTNQRFHREWKWFSARTRYANACSALLYTAHIVSCILRSSLCLNLLPSRRKYLLRSLFQSIPSLAKKLRKAPLQYITFVVWSITSEALLFPATTLPAGRGVVKSRILLSLEKTKSSGCSLMIEWAQKRV